MTGGPDIIFVNRQRRMRVDAAAVGRRWRNALPHVLEASREGSAIFGLSRIEITLVSDRVISRVHREFFDDPSATDVITFDHGEILLGASTIAANAADFGLAFQDEVILCGIHGMLHMGGWGDADECEAREMAALQEAIFSRNR